MKTTQDKKPRKTTNPNKIGDNRQKDGKFGPGNCANPNGRPEGAFSLLAILKQELQKCPEGQDKKTYADLIIKRMLKESIEKGDIQQIKLIWNYIEGMPKEKHDITIEKKETFTDEQLKSIASEILDGDNAGSKASD